jgi:multiple sugar transport system substrate-binding protein
MRKARWLVLVLVLTLSVMGLGSIHSNTPAAARQSTDITLMGWSSSQAEDDALQAQVDAFMEANPDINVTISLVPDYVTTIQTSFAAGDSPDVFYIDSSKLPDWVEAGVVASGEGKIVDPEGIFPSLLEVFTYDGTLYCPPKDFSTMTLQYNKDLFDAAGLDYPTADWTWDDLRAAAEALTQGDVIGLVTPPNFERWLPFLYQAGGSVLSDDWSEVTFDSDQSREALDFYLGMVNDGIAGPPSAVDAGWGGEAFGNGRVAMAMEGNWVIQYLLTTFPDLNWGVQELPTYSDGTRATMAFTVCYGVAAETPNADASWALVNFLTGEEGQAMVAEQGFGPMPVRTSAAATWLEVVGSDMQPFVTSADYAHKWQFPVGFQDVFDTFNAGLQQGFEGNATSDDIITETAGVAEEVLAR